MDKSKYKIVLYVYIYTLNCLVYFKYIVDPRSKRKRIMYSVAGIRYRNRDCSVLKFTRAEPNRNIADMYRLK